MGRVAVTTRPECNELGVEILKRCESHSYVCDVLVEQGVDLRARLRRRGSKGQQEANLGQRHIQRAAMADKAKPFCIVLTISTVAGLRPARFVHQALSFVVPDRLDITADLLGQIANLHVR